MKTCSRLTIAFLLLILVVPQVGASQRLFNIRLNLQQGDHFKYSSVAITAVDVAETQFSTTIDTTTSYKVVGVEENGNMTIQYATEGFTYRRSDSSGNTIEFNSENPIDLEKLDLSTRVVIGSMLPMVGKACTILVSPEGRVLRAEGIEEIVVAGRSDIEKIVQKMLAGIENEELANIIKARFKKAMEQLLSEENIKNMSGQAFNYLPSNAVQIGDSWSNAASLPVYNGTGQNETGWTLISVSPDFLSIKIHAKFNSGNHKGTMQGSSYGNLIVDRKSGLPVRSVSTGLSAITFKGLHGEMTIRGEAYAESGNLSHLKAYKFTEFNTIGGKHKEGTFLNGAENGIWTQWNEDGKKVREIQYKDGEEVSEKEF